MLTSCFLLKHKPSFWSLVIANSPSRSRVSIIESLKLFLHIHQIQLTHTKKSLGSSICGKFTLILYLQWSPFSLGNALLCGWQTTLFKFFVACRITTSYCLQWQTRNSEQMIENYQVSPNALTEVYTCTNIHVLINFYSNLLPNYRILILHSTVQWSMEMET